MLQAANTDGVCVSVLCSLLPQPLQLTPYVMC